MNNEQENGTAPGSVALDDLSQIFAPAWARSASGGEIRTVSTPEEPRNGRRDGRDHRPARRDSRNENGDRNSGKEEKRQRPPRRDRPFGDRAPKNAGGSEPRRPAPPKQEPINLDVRFMPAGKALASIVHRIQVSHRAYPIRDIVKLFQKDDASMSVRIEHNKSEDGTRTPVFQCGICGMPGLTREEIVSHLYKDHMPDFFDVETVEGEAPSGNFPCVARCGLTGELLGPPNHHSYARRVQEMLHDKFPGMSEEEYRRKIEIVRDPEVVEQWRNEAKKKVVFRLKPAKQEGEKEVKQADSAPAQNGPETAEGAEGAPIAEAPEEAAPEAAPEMPAFDRFQAEQYFLREVVSQNVKEASHIICPAVSLQKLANRRLASYLSSRFAEEENPHYRRPQQGEGSQPGVRRQGSLFSAIHAAFHHRKLHFFRVGDERGQEFVMAAPPTPFDATNATPELKAIVEYIQNNPACLAKSIVEDLNPENDEAKTKVILSDITWLLERNNLIQFFNGAISQPARYPVFRVNPEKKQKTGRPEAAKPAEVAPAEKQEEAPEAPAAVEAPAPEAAPAEKQETAAEAPASEAVSAPETDTQPKED